MPALLLAVEDELVRRRALRVAAKLGLEPLELGSAPASAAAAEHGRADEGAPEREPAALLAEREPAALLAEREPAALLVELERVGALESIASWRRRVPDLAIVAFLTAPDPDRWREAERAGADQVTTRGRADLALEHCASDRLSGARRARRLRVAPLADFAGRLGYVGRIEETPVGPLALFHLGGRLHAICDRCPHAGAPLGEGTLDGEVITCPRHGSQFCVLDGERLRGPADQALQTFPVAVESGIAFIELPG
jgi:nitrite reductase/ring-hydroxylating ferredoxin subunit